MFARRDDSRLRAVGVMDMPFAAGNQRSVPKAINGFGFAGRPVRRKCRRDGAQNQQADGAVHDQLDSLHRFNCPR